MEYSQWHLWARDIVNNDLGHFNRGILIGDEDNDGLMNFADPDWTGWMDLDGDGIPEWIDLGGDIDRDGIANSHDDNDNLDVDGEHGDFEWNGDSDGEQTRVTTTKKE